MAPVAGVRSNAPAVSARALAGAVVLVVDDSPANVLLLQRLLTLAGAAQVEGITDARQVTETYLRVQPDLVLLDLHMPFLDGIAVLESVKACTPVDTFVPIIVLTADTTVEAKNQALAAGANDFLTKPFEHTEVLLRVNNLLETRALHQALRRHNDDLRAEIRQKESLERQEEKQRAERRRRLMQVLQGDELTIVFQPIVNLRSDQLIGYEALARFTGEPYRPPDQWFADAAQLGLGVELELRAVQAAVQHLSRIPAGRHLSVNVSPETALHPELSAMIAPVAERIVLELTEHAAVTEYDALIERLAALRGLGLRIAVDDAGAGYSSLQHILRLCPDIVKLDIGLTRGIDSDPARRALGAALVRFGCEIHAEITAEGIEHPAELDTLRHIGAANGQGYLLGRPAPLPLAPGGVPRPT
jgi:EAL domain-containing protein (putative c-di-GMP-specific phosphodiesterase class I)